MRTLIVHTKISSVCVHCTSRNISEHVFACTLYMHIVHLFHLYIVHSLHVHEQLEYVLSRGHFYTHARTKVAFVESRREETGAVFLLFKKCGCFRRFLIIFFSNLWNASLWRAENEERQARRPRRLRPRCAVRGAVENFVDCPHPQSCRHSERTRLFADCSSAANWTVTADAIANDLRRLLAQRTKRTKYFLKPLKFMGEMCPSQPLQPLVI